MLTKFLQRTKVAGVGPTTRSRASITVTSNKGKGVTESVHPKETRQAELVPMEKITEEVGGSSLPPLVTEKTLERPQVVGNGSMAAFLEMRLRKTRNEVMKNKQKDVSNRDLDNENFIQEIQQGSIHVNIFM